MIRALIIDDEENCTKTLKRRLEDNCPSVEIVGILNDPLKAEEEIRKLKPDLLFLDIEMPHLNGFDILKLTKDVRYEVVFTTAYDHYAIQAFRHNALDYLLKPIDSEDLQAVVKKAEERKNTANGSKQSIEKIIEQFTKETKLNKLAIPSLEGIAYVDVDQVIRIEADGNYSAIHLLNGKKIVSSKALKEYEDVLTGGTFFRVHNSHLINLKFVSNYLKGEETLILTDGSKIEVSRRKKKELLDLLG
jgi:two-component system LytT family response regulator